MSFGQTILRPIHENQKISEANNVTLALDGLKYNFTLQLKAGTTVFMRRLPLFDGEISSSTQQTDQLGSPRCSLSPPDKSS